MAQSRSRPYGHPLPQGLAWPELEVGAAPAAAPPWPAVLPPLVRWPSPACTPAEPRRRGAGCQPRVTSPRPPGEQTWKTGREASPRLQQDEGLLEQMVVSKRDSVLHSGFAPHSASALPQQQAQYVESPGMAIQLQGPLTPPGPPPTLPAPRVTALCTWTPEPEPEQRSAPPPPTAESPGSRRQPAAGSSSRWLALKLAGMWDSGMWAAQCKECAIPCQISSTTAIQTAVGWQDRAHLELRARCLNLGFELRPQQVVENCSGRQSAAGRCICQHTHRCDLKITLHHPCNMHSLARHHVI